MRVQRSFKAALTGRVARLVAATGIGVVLSGALVATGAQAAPAGTGTAVEKKLTAVVINSTPEQGRPKFVPVFAHLIGDALAYCVDWSDSVANKDLYHEATGDEAKKVAIAADKVDAVTAILANGFGPQNSAADLLAAAGVTDLGGVSGADLDKVAFTGTQAAIWHTLVPGKFTLAAPGSVDDAQVKELGAKFADFQAVSQGEWNAADWLKKNKLASAVYKYLLGKLGTASLAISPATGTGTVGSKVGPFTVNSHGIKSADLKVSTGGALVDKDGKPVTTVKDGGQFWVDCKSEGTVTVTATGKTKVVTVKLWTGIYTEGVGRNKQEKPLQTLANVVVTEKDLTANATVTCNAVPATPSLPVTGAPVLGTIAAAWF